MIRIRSVLPLGGFLVRLEFSDGVVKEVDLESSLRGPMFERARSDPEFFKAVRIDPESGTITWPNGADLDPDVLRFGLDPSGYLAPWIPPATSLADYSRNSAARYLAARDRRIVTMESPTRRLLPRTPKS
jgi:hypothetical protein